MPAGCLWKGEGSGKACEKLFVAQAVSLFGWVEGPRWDVGNVVAFAFDMEDDQGRGSSEAMSEG